MLSYDLPAPYLLFTAEAENAQTDGKTAAGVAYWSREKCIGQLWEETSRLDLKLPRLSLDQAAAKGARTLIIGVAPMGGNLNEKWIHTIVDALEKGLNVAAGFHTRLGSIPKIHDAAKKHGGRLFDVRFYDDPIPPPTAKKRSGIRLLTVGTDCSVGKMYAALAIAKGLKEIGIDATFRATGQTGVLIAGSGIAVDNLAADYFVGAVELLSPSAPEFHWDIIEGQGAFFHPQSAGGTLLLIHGAQPDFMVLCHNPARKSMYSYPDYPIRDLEEYIEEYEKAAKLTNPNAKVVGICLNTSQFSKDEGMRLIKHSEEKNRLPCFDPLLTDIQPFIKELANL